MRANIYSHYRVRRKQLLAFIAFFIIYFFITAVPGYSPFPFFNWGLFVGTPKNANLYDIMVIATEPSKKLTHPIPLHLLTPELHRDWHPSPYKAIQRFGWLIDEDVWDKPLSIADKHMKLYFTDGASPTGENIIQAQGLVENFMIGFPYLEYVIIKRQYNALVYSQTKQTEDHIIGYYKKVAVPK